MHARAASLMVLLLAASLGHAASAQGTTSPSRVTLLAADPAGDPAVSKGPLAQNTPSFANVDILSVLAIQATGTTPRQVEFDVNFSAPPTARQVVTFQFTLAKGPDSDPASTASGAEKTLTVTGTTVSGADGATATAGGNRLGLAIPYASIGASPGDVVSGLSVTARDHDGGTTANGPLGDPTAQDDSDGTDRAPDQGTAPAYTLTPPPFASSLLVTVTGGEITDGDGTRSFSGPLVATRDGNATVRFDLTVTNLARGPDQVRLTTPGPEPELRFTVPEGPVTIPAQGKALISATARLVSAPPGTLSAAFQVDGLAGGARADATLVVQAVPAGHHAIPAALSFLTPVVASLGLEGPLGDYAELAFLLVCALVAVVVLFLLLFLVQTPWLRVAVEPRRAVVVPGGAAEFRIRLDRARRGVASAKAVLRSAPWASGFRFGRSPASTVPVGQPVDIRVDPDNPATGILRVQVPPGTASLDRATVEFDIVPVDAQGQDVPRHSARSHVTVQAVQPATTDPAVPKARDIRLAAVKHEPPDPLPGGTVTTTATIHNVGALLAPLRIVLRVDGNAVVEQRIEVAPRSTRDVALPWTAGAGKNQVKVQVFLA
jgi:hypothetical protein